MISRLRGNGPKLILVLFLMCLVFYVTKHESNGITWKTPARANIAEYTQDNSHKSTDKKPESVPNINRKHVDQEHRATNSLIGSITGALFSGDVIREMISIPNEKSISKPIIVRDEVKSCEKYAVVTTIFKASDAVSYVAKNPLWCMVIIADKKSLSKKDYVAQIKPYDPWKHIYLTVEEQEAMFPVLSKVTPYNSFARKNIGYMYAIHKGARFIWDFDDDNKGIIEVSQLERISSEYVTPCEPLKHKVVNPYFYYGVNETYTWPRGIPLQLIREPSTNPKLCQKSGPVELGVLQSLANNQPDVDAIYRLTRDTPFNFKAKVDTHKVFLLPQNAYCPFNAQATLWTAHAFEYLLLPVSVNGRVSDIWRSYFAEFFFHLSGKVKMAFAPPYVFQDRNVHNYIQDFNAELDLYQKSKQLVEFLSNPETSQKHKTMVSLYNELYRRGYIEQEDVHYILAWYTTLKDIQKAT